MDEQPVQSELELSKRGGWQSSDDAMQSAMNISFRLVLWPCLVVLLFLAKSHVHFPMRDAYHAIMLIVLVATSAASFMIGDCIGFLAHYLFRHRIKLPVSFAAGMMTLVFDFVLIGWTLVVFRAI